MSSESIRLHFRFNHFFFFPELVNNLQSYSFEDRSHINVISTMREAKNYLNKINNIDFGSTIEPKKILK